MSFLVYVWKVQKSSYNNPEIENRKEKREVCDDFEIFYPR